LSKAEPVLSKTLKNFPLRGFLKTPATGLKNKKVPAFGNTGRWLLALRHNVKSNMPDIL
jgi:hypothetical protein